MLTAAGIGAMTFVAALILMKKHYWESKVPWLMLVAGAFMSGVLGGLIYSLVTRLLNGVDSLTARLLGTGTGGLVVLVVMSLSLFPHMKRGGQDSTKLTPWLALLFVPVMIATGQAFGDLAGTGKNVVTEIATQGWATITDIAAGF